MKIGYGSKSRILALDKGQELIDVITGNKTPLDYNSVEQWINQCYSMPRDSELILQALDEILEGYGVESIDGDSYINSYYRYSRGSYINTGDTYSQTLVLDHKNDTIHLTSWGDFVETQI